MTNVNDLRIVKLYHVHSFDTNDYGYVIGRNVLKDRSNFVLVKQKQHFLTTKFHRKNRSKTALCWCGSAVEHHLGKIWNA